MAKMTTPMKSELPTPTAPIASGLRRPTISVSTIPRTIQPISATTTGSPNRNIGLNSPLRLFNDGMGSHSIGALKTHAGTLGWTRRERRRVTRSARTEPTGVHLDETAKLFERFGIVVDLEAEHDVVVQPH